MSLPGSALNPQLLITALVTVVSLLVGLLVGNFYGSGESAKRSFPKLIVNSTQQLAEVLAQVEEGSLKITEDDKIGLATALLQNLDEEAHPDADVLHYIASEVLSKRHPGQIYEVWLTRAYRRLAENPSNRLPEAWFVEPVAPAAEDDSDTSGIAEVAEDDEDEFYTEAGPLVSPNVSSNNLSFETSDELNTARLHCFGIPAEVGLPQLQQHLDMTAVD